MHSNKDGKAKGLWGIGCLVRRKQVDSVFFSRATGAPQLAKRLSVVDLIAIGVGTTIGAGVYVLVGTVARAQAGPALTLSFLIAGIAAALSAFCYAELVCRFPSAGSAYHYAYICLGEGAAWLIGWALILEYTVGGSAIARGITPNLALFFGGEDRLPSFLSRHTIPGLDIVVDPSAAVLVLIVAVLLCLGIKESSFAQTIVTTVNICGMLFIVIAGGYLAFKTGWVGYELPSGYFPYGVNGMLAGSAVVFFSFIGFDAVASTAEEVKSPQRDLPVGIGMALSICCILYMLVSFVIVGLVPYYTLDPGTPIASAFASHGMQWAMYVITTAAVTALCSSLMGSLLPQPRMFMAMARDGLLPSFFSDISERTQVPVKSTIMIGTISASLAFLMDVSQLAGMVSVGTLLAFTGVAISLLVVRYVPPDEVPLPSSLEYSGEIQDDESQQRNKNPDVCCGHSWHSPNSGETSSGYPLLDKPIAKGEQNQQKRRQIASWSIATVCTGIFVLSFAASLGNLPSILRFVLCTVGGAILLCSLTILACIAQDNERHNFGHVGGFTCPFVPYLPVCCVLVNTYLIVNLGAGTWIRVSMWLLVGVVIYLFYGRTHSSLINTVFVPNDLAAEMYRASSSEAV